MEKKNPIYNLAIEKINQAKEKCISNFCINPAGVLWESLWKQENGKIMQKTCCSGLFNNWYCFENEEQAIKKMIRELEVIEKVRKEG